MTVALLPDYVAHSLKPNFEPLNEAPNYVRSANATRWHRARSGHRREDGRISYGYWCGSNYGDCGVESIGPDEPLCATCEGRFEAQQENRLLFDPLKAQRPKVCPASRRTDMIPPGGNRYFHCLACGEITSWRVYGTPYYGGDAKVQKHAPGDGLVDPCRIHGWFRLVVHGDAVVCACTVVQR
jgi:hypothetical protein